MKRERWVDICKGIAILAVVADHCLYLFPQIKMDLLWKHTYFSVPWFIFLSGYTNSLSAQKIGKWNIKSYLSFWKRRFSLLIPYLLISLFIYSSYHNFKIDWMNFWFQALSFTIQPTYYFINLILQFYLIFPPLYHLLNISKTAFQKIIISAVIFFLSFYVLPAINPTWPFSPAGRMFGGLYLAVFYIGMLFGQRILVFSKLVSILSTFSFIVMEYCFFLLKAGFIGIIQNPLSIAWSSSMLLFVKAILNIKKVDQIFFLKPLALLGKYTLFIYLIHFYIITYFYELNIISLSIYWIVFIYFASILVPILANIIYNEVGSVTKTAIVRKNRGKNILV